MSVQYASNELAPCYRGAALLLRLMRLMRLLLVVMRFVVLFTRLHQCSDQHGSLRRYQNHVRRMQSVQLAAAQYSTSIVI